MKFQCTNSECTSTSITPAQVQKAMKQKPVKKRPAPSTTGSTFTTPDLQQPASATTPIFEHHEALPDFMSNMIDQMNEFREQHRLSNERQILLQQEHEQLKATNDQLASALQELQQLRTTIQEKDLIIQRQQQELESLQSQGTTTTTTTNDSSASKYAPQGQWADQSKVQQLHTILAEGPQSKAMKKQQAAARLFSPPSTNQGFQHIYLPTRARLRISQIRQNLRKLGIDNNRVLDINYPAMNTTALLVHNEYVDELINRLSTAGITPIDNFDPTDQQHLKDPKYADYSKCDRSDIAFNLHQQRMLRSLDFIRAPAKYSVANCFARQEWITNEQLQSVLQSKNNSSPSSAFILNDESNNPSIDMEEDEPLIDQQNTSNNQPQPDINQ
jgi:hypothetical protein